MADCHESDEERAPPSFGTESSSDSVDCEVEEEKTGEDECSLTTRRRLDDIGQVREAKILFGAGGGCLPVGSMEERRWSRGEWRRVKETDEE
jgi:hypothetical protein